MIFSQFLRSLFLSLLFFSCRPDFGNPELLWFDYLVIKNNTTDNVSMLFGAGYEDNKIFFNPYFSTGKKFEIGAGKEEVVSLNRFQDGEIVFYLYSENGDVQGWITSRSGESPSEIEKVSLDNLDETFEEKYTPQYEKWNEFVDFSKKNDAQVYDFGKWGDNDYYCYYAGCIYIGDEENRTSLWHSIKSKRLFRKLNIEKGKYTFGSSSASEWLNAFKKSRYSLEDFSNSSNYHSVATDMKNFTP